MALLVAAVLATPVAFVAFATSATVAAQDGAGSPPLPEPQPSAGPSSPGALPFSALSYEEAQRLADDQGKLFIVDTTATWCVPCRQMERNVWPAPEVVAWLALHAVAVQVDIDAQKPLAEGLKLDSLPTILVFDGDVELDRRSGALDAGELVAWLDGVASGLAGREPLAAKARELLTSDDVEARYAMAQELMRHGEHKLALKHYLWLWPNTRSIPKYFGIRCTYMLMDLKTIADRDDDSFEAVARLFEEVRGKVLDTDSPDPVAWIEFTSWCRTFEHDNQPLDWYDRHHAPDGSVADSPVLTSTLLELLSNRGRWADAGRLGKLPELAEKSLETYRKERLDLRSDTTSSPQELRGIRMQSQRGVSADLARISAALWAAGDADAARAVAGSLLAELDDAEAHLALVDFTLKAVGAQPEQLVWLDKAAAKGGDKDRIAKLRATVRNKFKEQAAAEKAAPSIPKPRANR